MITKLKVKEFLKLRSNSNLVDSVNKFLDLSEDELRILRDIDYLNKNFDLLTMSESLANYRKNENQY